MFNANLPLIVPFRTKIPFWAPLGTKGAFRQGNEIYHVFK